MTAITEEAQAEQRTPDLLWLDLTRKCQLDCGHCYNASGPDGAHGTMTRADWLRVLDQAAACGTRRVQFIGGEPTLHPDALDLVGHALSLGLLVEVYSNLVHVSPQWWATLRRDGVSLATSYYSDRADEHDEITGRRTHARTRANIETAVRLGIPLRVGITAATGTQRVDEARRELAALGVRHISVDHVRPFGRAAAEGQAPDISGLCGRCGTGRAAVSPTGEVSPCVFSGWMGVGNVRDAALGTLLGSPAMADAGASIRSATARGEDGDCGPVGDGECSPGFPSSSCTPRN